MDWERIVKVVLEANAQFEVQAGNNCRCTDILDKDCWYMQSEEFQDAARMSAIVQALKEDNTLLAQMRRAVEAFRKLGADTLIEWGKTWE